MEAPPPPHLRMRFQGAGRGQSTHIHSQRNDRRNILRMRCGSGSKNSLNRTGMALTDKQRRFVDEYLLDLNATQAAIRAGYSTKNANKVGPEILGKTWFQVALSERRKEMASKTAITPELVLAKWWELANVDANELVEYRRDNCRHCWGEDHEYQWTHGEFEKAQRDAENEGKADPSCAGGFGFDANRDPNPACPECGGEGRGKIHVHDTRKLKGAARRLYAGVHQGKDGLKVLLEDRGKALDAVTRILGMYNDKRDDDGKALAAEKLRIENDRLRKGLDEDDSAPPTPVKVVVEVKDARKRDDA